VSNETRPHPRILVVGATEHSEIGKAVARLGGSPKFATSEEGEAAREGDFSALIQVGHRQNLIPRSWNVLYFMDEDTEGRIPTYHDKERLNFPYHVIGERPGYAQEFVVDRGTADHYGVHELCLKSIIAPLRNNPDKTPHLIIRFPNESEWDKACDGYIHDQDIAMAPLVAENRADPVAVVLWREEDEDAEHNFVYLLPSVTTHRSEWVARAYENWSDNIPTLFPALIDTGSDEKWMTPDKACLHRELVAYQDETELIVRERHAHAETLLLKRDQTDANVQQGMQRLLYTNGEPLVLAVSQALSCIGFDVIDSDLLPENAAARNEDLQVSIDGNWTAIVEVKGYSDSSGKARDLNTLRRYAGIYEGRKGLRPDAAWYIVNGQFSRQPREREEPLGSSPYQIQSFAEEDFSGVVISTATLFLLWKDVVTGHRDGSQIMDHLKSCKGAVRYEDFPTGDV